jgi:hypothetical protein
VSESPFTSPAAEQATDTEAESASRKPLLLALGALAAVALGAGAFLFLGGDDAAEQQLAAPGTVPAAAAPAPAASASALPVASKVELGRNPFKALYVQPVVAPASTSAPTTVGTGTGTPGGATAAPAPAPVTGGIPIVGVPQIPSTGTGSESPAPSPAPATKPELRLVSATHVGHGEHVGVFAVGDVEETVKVGDTFGPDKHLLLLSLQQGPGDDQWTAVVQIGDGDPFDVVTGSPVLLQ